MRSNTLFVSKTLAVALALGTAGTAFAAPGDPTTTDMNVSLTIVNECKSAVVDDLDFGEHGVLDANVDAEATISFTCSTDLPFDVALDAGQGAGATTSARVMTSGTDMIGYQLFRVNDHTGNWGDVVDTDTLGGTGMGSSQDITVYGRVPVQTTPAAGDYSDIVHVTVTY